MTDDSLTRLIKSLQDGQPASVQLSTTAGHGVAFSCLYKEANAPHFFVVTPPKTIPEDVDRSAPCIVSLQDDQGATFAITARIVDITSERSLELMATKAIDPISLREYFRVDLRTAITVSYETLDPKSPRNWSIKGQTLDISGSGVLGLFGQEPKNANELFIDIHLTHPEKLIHCVGHVVRTNRLRGGRWQVALHFDNISQRDRDAIITNCLWEQRRQLRERVKTADE